MSWDNTRYDEVSIGAFGRVAYTTGPATIGVPPSAAAPYSTYYSAYYDTAVGTVHVQTVSAYGEEVLQPNTGTSYPYFGAISDPRNATNLSVAFDNQGQLLFGIQDNSTNPPTVRIAGSGGSYTRSWAGYKPIVFNGVEMFTGRYATGDYSAMHSGVVGCIYTDSADSQLYARYLADGYSREYTFTLGGTTGQMMWLAGGFPALFSTTAPYLDDDAIEPYEMDTESAMDAIGYDTVAFEELGRHLSGLMVTGWS
jgi:hypothetical protein